MSNDQTTGTSGLDDRDALDQPGTTETPDTEGRDAESVTLTKKQWEDALKWKASAEKVNELEAKVEALSGGSSSPPVTESPEVQAKSDQIDQVESQVEEFRRRGDPVAAFAMEERAARLRLERDLIYQRQLDRIPEAEQEAVLNHFNKNRHRLGDIKAARSELRESALEVEVRKLAEENERLKRGPDPDVVKAPPTHGHEFTARETKKRLTEAQFDATAASIRASKGELAYMKYVRENAGNVQ